MLSAAGGISANDRAAACVSLNTSLGSRETGAGAHGTAGLELQPQFTQRASFYERNQLVIRSKIA
jgi:hypothetical protein